MFQGLKCTSMHVTDLTSPYFDTKLVYEVIGFFESKYGRWRHEKCRNARLCIFQVFSTIFDIKKKTILKVIGFWNQNMVDEEMRHAQTCVSGPKTHVYACLRFSSTIFWLKKPITFQIVFFFNQKWCEPTWKKQKRAFMLFSELLPPFLIETKNLKKIGFFYLKYGGWSPETSINVCFRAWNARLCMSQILPRHILIQNQFIK